MMLDFLPRLTCASPQGAIGRLSLNQLKPTQNAVGMDEVKAKADKIAAMDDKKLGDYLLQRVIPVVIGNPPKGSADDAACFYLVDHHHLAAALWRARSDPKFQVFAEVRCNWLPLTGTRFWKAMVRNAWLYPFDGLGAGPLAAAQLTPTIMDLENDLYRSLAWVVRENYGYAKDPQNPTFAEFRWAAFLRARVLFDAQLTCEKDSMKLTLADIKDADPEDYAAKIAYARYLASSPQAAGLPGFLG
ncbi:MAG: hypothetical protein IPL45_06900 [Actinomycetales bacterium]|nr:hypothetical protein [Actinomycetales bacterium]